MLDAALAETAVPDIRETSTPDAAEHTDPEPRRRIPPMAETIAQVERARAAVARWGWMTQRMITLGADATNLRIPDPVNS